MTRRVRRLAVVAVLAIAVLPGSALATLPHVDYTLSGRAGDNGWFVGPVTITWTVTDATDAPDCRVVETIRDDTTGTQRTCTASNGDGTVPAQTKVIKIDQTPPSAITASPVRPPDASPFYTAPIAVSWSGTDTTSGIAACTTATYTGPDAPTAAPAGVCRDRAGNVSAPVALTFAYDATAPPLSDLTATAHRDRRIALAWTTSADAQTATVVRQPGNVTIVNGGPATTHALTDGPLSPATPYAYTITLRDAAGNATSATAGATTPQATTAAASKATKNFESRTLRWKAQPGAEYYNLQLFRNGRKVLSVWPTRAQYTLHAAWRFGGRTQRLAAGRYRWYVWPGYGRRATHRYGRLHAKGALAISKATASVVISDPSR
jgi:hypothetical protein